MNSELKAFVGREVDLSMTDEEVTHCDQYWEYVQGFSVVFRGKNLRANVLSTPWIGGVGQKI